MEGTGIISLAQPRGPRFYTKVRVNYQLGLRMARASGMRTDEVDGRLALELGENLGDAGPPASRTVREWAQKEPGYPERMIQNGTISKNDIRPELRRYLEPGNSSTSMGQLAGSQPTYHTVKTQVSGQVNEEADPVWGVAKLMIIGICIGAIFQIGKESGSTRSSSLNRSQANNYSWDRRGLRQVCVRPGRGNF